MITVSMLARELEVDQHALGSLFLVNGTSNRIDVTIEDEERARALVHLLGADLGVVAVARRRCGEEVSDLVEMHPSAVDTALRADLLRSFEERVAERPTLLPTRDVLLAMTLHLVLEELLRYDYRHSVDVLMDILEPAHPYVSADLIGTALERGTPALFETSASGVRLARHETQRLSARQMLVDACSALRHSAERGQWQVCLISPAPGVDVIGAQVRPELVITKVAHHHRYYFVILVEHVPAWCRADLDFTRWAVSALEGWSPDGPATRTTGRGPVVWTASAHSANAMVAAVEEITRSWPGGLPDSVVEHELVQDSDVFKRGPVLRRTATVLPFSGAECCLECGRTLTEPFSIARGYGPWCWRRHQGNSTAPGTASSVLTWRGALALPRWATSMRARLHASSTARWTAARSQRSTAPRAQGSSRLARTR